MNLRKTAALTAASMLIFHAPVWADNHEANGPQFNMIHVRTCNFNDGQGFGDFDRVVRDWNRWADRQDVNDYLAFAMTPNFHGPDTFDLGWIGMASSAESLGAALDLYAADGGDIASDFADVVTCDTHGMFASSVVKAASDSQPPDNVVIVFRDCKIADGVTFEQLGDAQAQWGAFMTENGYPQGEWMWWPVFGGGAVEFDYKLVQGFPNHAAVGKLLEMYGNGGGWRTHNELLGDKVQCDDGRVYDGRVQRRMEESG